MPLNCVLGQILTYSLNHLDNPPSRSGLKLSYIHIYINFSHKNISNSDKSNIAYSIPS